MKKSDGTVTMSEFEIVVARLPVSQAEDVVVPAATPRGSA